jgi:Zn-dependent peptidase ImmA (M78 family)/DNA-binding XRE family transcriptional regulator
MQDSLFEIRHPLVNGTRVKQARELNGLTQATLADAIYVDQTMIAHIEGGTKQPTVELLETLSKLLDLPIEFFRQQNPIDMPKGSLLFRSKAIVGKRTISQAYEYSRLAVELALRLSSYAKLVTVRIAPFSDPLEAARELRGILDLPVGPVENAVRCAERLGVLVIPLPDVRDCDAFATWTGSQSLLPVIGLAAGRPVDRLRLNLAHELGHIALHRSIHSASKENEQEAYTFAAEFLMPATEIYPDLTADKISLFRLAELKKKWNVSMQAILRRARELSILNDRQYRYLMLQISQRGWRTEEPSFSTSIEKPRALRKLSEVAFGGDETWDRLATEFRLSLPLVTSILGACESTPIKPEATKLAKELSQGGRLISFSKQSQAR